MRRVLRPLVAAASLLGLAACGAVGHGTTAPDPRAALPRAVDLPGSGWSLVGTTDRRPAATDDPDPLDGADGVGDACKQALDTLNRATNDPADDGRFARAVYRSAATSGSQERGLTVTVESAQVAGARAAAITQVTQACTRPMTTKAGAQDLTVRISRTRYATPGAVGYTVTYDADGLKHYFDMVVATSGSDGVTASTTGPDAAADRAVLDAALTQTLAHLRPGSSAGTAGTGSSGGTGATPTG